MAADRLGKRKRTRHGSPSSASSASSASFKGFSDDEPSASNAASQPDSRRRPTGNLPLLDRARMRGAPKFTPSPLSESRESSTSKGAPANGGLQDARHPIPESAVATSSSVLEPGVGPDQGGLATSQMKNHKTSKRKQPRAVSKARGLHAAGCVTSSPKRHEMSDSARIAASAEVRRLMSRTTLGKAPVKSWKTEPPIGSAPHTGSTYAASGSRGQSETSSMLPSDVEQVAVPVHVTSSPAKTTSKQSPRGIQPHPTSTSGPEPTVTRPIRDRPLQVPFDLRRATAVPTSFDTDNDEDVTKRLEIIEARLGSDSGHAYDADESDSDDESSLPVQGPTDGSGSNAQENSGDQRSRSTDNSLEGEISPSDQPRPQNDTDTSDTAAAAAPPESLKQHNGPSPDHVVVLSDDTGDENVDGDRAGAHYHELVRAFPHGKAQSPGENMNLAEGDKSLTTHSVDDRNLASSTHEDGDTGTSERPAKSRNASPAYLPSTADDESGSTRCALFERRPSTTRSDMNDSDAPPRVYEHFEQPRLLLPVIADTVPPTPESLSPEVPLPPASIDSSGPPRKKQKQTGITSKHFSSRKCHDRRKAKQKDESDANSRDARSPGDNISTTSHPGLAETLTETTFSTPTPVTAETQEEILQSEQEPSEHRHGFPVKPDEIADRYDDGASEAKFSPTLASPTDRHDGNVTQTGHFEEPIMMSQHEKQDHGTESAETSPSPLPESAENTSKDLPHDITAADMSSDQSVTSSGLQTFQPGSELQRHPSSTTPSKPVLSERTEMFSMTPEYLKQESPTKVAPKTPALPAKRRLRKTSLSVSDPQPPPKTTGRASRHFNSGQKLLDGEPDSVDRTDREKPKARTRTRTRTPTNTAIKKLPPISAERFGLIQEDLWQEPFWLMVAVVLLNRTNGKSAIPVLHELKERWPTPETILEGNEPDLLELITHLGLQNQRTKTIRVMARQWLEDPPISSKLRKIKGTGYPGLTKDFLQDDASTAHMDEGARAVFQGMIEIGHIHGCGRYAYDSWRMFCRDALRGVAEDYNGKNAAEGFEPEWKRVLPTDQKLILWMRWMWLREGFVWDSITGDRRRATPAEMEEARQGRVDAYAPVPPKLKDATPLAEVAAPEVAMNDDTAAESAQDAPVAEGAVIANEGNTAVQDEAAITAIDDDRYALIDPSVLTRASGLSENQLDNLSLLQKMESPDRRYLDDVEIATPIDDEKYGAIDPSFLTKTSDLSGMQQGDALLLHGSDFSGDAKVTTTVDGNEYGVIDPSVLTKIDGLSDAQHVDVPLLYRSGTPVPNIPEGARLYYSMSDDGEGDNILVVTNHRRLSRMASATAENKKHKKKGKR